MKLLMTLFSLLFTFIVHAQKVVRIYLDDNMPVTTVINEGKVFTASFPLKNYKKATRLTLKFENKEQSRKHTLLVTNNTDSTLITIPENGQDINSFKIDVIKLRAVTSRYKNLKLVYLEEPRNPMMRISSRSTLLMNIHFK